MVNLHTETSCKLSMLGRGVIQWILQQKYKLVIVILEAIE